MRVDAAFSRPRFRCKPADGIKGHTFSLTRRQPSAGHPHGAICLECERSHGRTDGPTTVKHYAQTINEVGSVLAAVGAGISLRVASRDIRINARRYSLGRIPKTDGTVRRRRDYSSRQNVLAARYLDAYGPRVLERILPDHWPRLLVLDSKPLHIRPYGEVSWDDWAPSMPGGALLAAAGKDEDEGVTRTWRVSLGGDETHHSWLRFFGELDKGDPEWVVADRADAIWKAVGIRWPNATIFACAWHLRKNLIQAAFRDGVYHDESPFFEAIAGASHSVPEWEGLFDMAEAKGADNIKVWIGDNDALIRRQIDLRSQFPRRPRSNSPAETAIKTIDGFIGKRRRNFRNAGRLATVLGLMTANVRQVGDAASYAHAVREFIVEKGQPDLEGGMDHGAFVNDTGTSKPSLALLLMAAGDVSVAAKRASDVDAKARSVQRTADGFNIERARLGLPLIEVRISKGGTASISAKGKLLTDFFEFSGEWDTAKNGRGPEGITAGHGATISWWMCASGHSWDARVGDRIIRLLRCQRCFTNRADPSKSLAAVYPVLLAAWDDDANRPLDPNTIRSTYSRSVKWRCLEGLGHPRYGASIAKRRSDEVPCPICRKMRQAPQGKVGLPPRRRSEPVPVAPGDLFGN
jgi:hypothetical protein